MQPVILAIDQFSDDPGNNYLQFLLTYAVSQGSSEIYFYIESENIRVYRNLPRGSGADIANLKDVLPPDEYENLLQFMRVPRSDLPQRVAPKGFMEEVPLPISALGNLESALERIYQLENIAQLEEISAEREISVGGTRIQTRLERISKKDGLGYHMKIEYLSSP